ncbi:MAG: hypothetical protein Q7R30_22930 [Acidobacteriota bacterium]|nr:hypothetical protein [Acidobacteriota bacterium]
MRTTPNSSRGTSGQPGGLPAHALSGIVGLLLFAFLTVSYAQRAVPSGEEVYVDRLGCWNCHGTTGQGAGGGVVLTKTPLALRKFVSYVRLPSKEMPPFAPIMASDAELAIVYRWLDGSEAVKAPPAITVDLKSSAAARTGGQASAEVSVELIARVAETALPSDVPVAASLGYRVTLTSDAGAPLANHAVEYQRAGRNDWSKFTTDEHGEALLGADRGVVLAKAGQTDKARARLRTALPAGKTALVVETLDYTAPANLVVVGIGSAILRVE